MIRLNPGSNKIVILNCSEIVIVMTRYDLIPFLTFWELFTLRVHNLLFMEHDN